jgi:hypothetical protein
MINVFYRKKVGRNLIKRKRKKERKKEKPFFQNVQNLFLLFPWYLHTYIDANLSIQIYTLEQNQGRVGPPVVGFGWLVGCRSQSYKHFSFKTDDSIFEPTLSPFYLFPTRKKTLKTYIG